MGVLPGCNRAEDRTVPLSSSLNQSHPQCPTDDNLPSGSNSASAGTQDCWSSASTPLYRMLWSELYDQFKARVLCFLAAFASRHARITGPLKQIKQPWNSWVVESQFLSMEILCYCTSVLECPTPRRRCGKKTSSTKPVWMDTFVR